VSYIFNNKIFLLCLGVSLLGILGGVHVITIARQAGLNSIEFQANNLLEICAEAPVKQYCYEQNVPKLLGDYSTEEIFAIIRTILRQDKDYQYCHVLAHKIGEYEVARDPDNWMSALATGPTDGLCSNGYAHGAIVARFNEEYFNAEDLRQIEPELAAACEARGDFVPTELQRAMCYHDLGHVIIHLTDAEVGRALAACEEIAVKENGQDFRRVCYEGVYMQLFQPLEPEDEALIDQLAYRPTRDNIAQFCADNSDTQAQYDTCWREAWPLYYEELQSGPGIDKFCGELPPGDGRESCYITAFTINGRHNLANQDQIITVCEAVAADRRGECYARAANDYLEEGQDFIEDGVSFCGRAVAETDQAYCYQYLASVSSFNFNSDSPAHQKVCNALPVEWQSVCQEN